jgi:hypothetical protein
VTQFKVLILSGLTVIMKIISQDSVCVSEQRLTWTSLEYQLKQYCLSKMWSYILRLKGMCILTLENKGNVEFHSGTYTFSEQDSETVVALHHSKTVPVCFSM